LIRLDRAVLAFETDAPQRFSHLAVGLGHAKRRAALAQGMVEFEGQWMSPSEREARLRIHAAESAAMRENALADARVAEAEARAREAEARARAAEADAARAEDTFDDGGIPLIGYGSVGFGGPVVIGPAVQPCCGQRHAPGFCPTRRRTHNPAPQPTQPPRERPHDRQPQAPLAAPVPRIKG